jgi:hypothetical protein
MRVRRRRITPVISQWWSKDFWWGSDNFSLQREGVWWWRSSDFIFFRLVPIFVGLVFAYAGFEMVDMYGGSDSKPQMATVINREYFQGHYDPGFCNSKGCTGRSSVPDRWVVWVRTEEGKDIQIETSRATYEKDVPGSQCMVVARVGWITKTSYWRFQSGCVSNLVQDPEYRRLRD